MSAPTLDRPPFQPTRWGRDPRPDLADDSAWWQELLTRAYLKDGQNPRGLFGGLHGLRCLGARLVVRDGRVRLAPGELDPAEYAALRECYLLPFAEVLTECLRRVGRVVAGADARWA